MIRSAMSALGWIGQRGTLALTASILIGMTLPFLSAYARPFITEAVFALLVLAFLRVDPDAVRQRSKRPVIFILASCWIMIAVPLFAAAALALFGGETLDPQVILTIFIVSAAPPVMSAPAFIYLMGLNGALSLTILIASTVLTPLTAPFMAELMIGDALDLDSLELALSLGTLLGGSLLVATVIRKVVGSERIVAGKSNIDGLNVLVLLFFAVAAMDGVAASFATRPGLTFAIAALTFVVAFFQIGIAMLVFYRVDRADAFAIAHSAGNRNMGLMVAALGGSLPELTWLWFALGQLPIYMLPMILKPLVRQLIAKPEKNLLENS
ncbi:sodium:proton symporter [Roseibium polysiphoniae]|uniref:Sodium:proton symporter n=1 Tax=Roseibium polysiphoniae TaxID=2571221 RepID=A0A944GVQ6_9HYPH|nr:sodium:proton symporter [Roseibium polysiphoniae]MBS8262735.1 sodium:proton symporter [Roseibium polysiphoniae]